MNSGHCSHCSILYQQFMFGRVSCNLLSDSNLFSISFSVVIGYDEGTIMVKMGREIPVASMDNSGKIIWAKHNEIQTVDIRRVGAGYEV